MNYFIKRVVFEMDWKNKFSRKEMINILERS